MTFLKKEILRNKPNQIVFVLVAAAAAIISVGYVLFLAILAPEQLAEATAAATDLVCTRCVGTSDIADSAVTSIKIADGRVRNNDLATDAVTSAKIGASQVTNSDLATSAVTSSKISDTSGVQSVDIVNGQVNSSDIVDSAVTSAKIFDGEVYGNDIADGSVGSTDISDGAITSDDITYYAIDPNVFRVIGTSTDIEPGFTDVSFAHCPTGTFVVGGGYVQTHIIVKDSYPYDVDTWAVDGTNDGTATVRITAMAVCAGSFPAPPPP
jgi:hypothetical protein